MIKTIPVIRSDAETLRLIADAFERAAGTSEDKPEGTHTVTITATLLRELAGQFRSIADRTAEAVAAPIRARESPDAAP